MHVELPGSVAGSAQVAPVIELIRASKWYGNVIGVNNLTLKIFPGVTGVLGPNGAGKSTLLQLLTGQLQPSQGDVRVLGQYPWNNASLNRYIGLCPEQDAFYEWMTGYEFVYNCARLSGMPTEEAKQRALHSIEQVHMSHAMNRPVKGYSKGMRQRTKLAQSLVHDPEILFLDEPLTGTDPIARRELVDIILALGKQGKSVLVSSHVLYEVQSLTSNVLVLNRGKLVAEGHIREIRDLIDKHPHRIILIADEYRALAAQLLSFPDVLGVDVEDGYSKIVVETNKPDVFYSRLTDFALAEKIRIHEVYSEDDNLESVFKYLVNS